MLILIYLADVTGTRWLSWLRNPVFKAGMAGIMMLVMFFYHFMLGPTLPDLPLAIDISNVLLHYCTPVLFLAWWAAWSPHGALRYRDVPAMLVPGLAYVLYVELPWAARGRVSLHHPRSRLRHPGQPPGGYAAVAISVGVLVALVAIFDLLLVFIDGPIAKRRADSLRELM